MELTKQEQKKIDIAWEASVKFLNEGDIRNHELALAQMDYVYKKAELRAKAKADAEDKAWWTECEHRQNVKLGIHDDYLERSGYYD